MKEKNDILTTSNWTNILDNFKLCPHALSGKTLRVSSRGTNPYIYTDFDRTVFYDEKGFPEGSNSEIMYNIGKVFGFKVAFNLSNSFAGYFDNKTQRWIGLTGDVRTNQT